MTQHVWGEDNGCVQYLSVRGFLEVQLEKKCDLQSQCVKCGKFQMFSVSGGCSLCLRLHLSGDIN